VTERVPIEQVKIYGERNTGTRFLQTLMKRNFVATILDGTASTEERETRKELVKNLDEWLITMIVKDRFEAHANKRLVSESFGWKHTNPPIEFLRSVPDRTAKTLFVALVKHPVYWTLSFQKRPYHSYFRYQTMSFHDFVRHIFIPTGRDNVDPAFYDSVVELYAAKMDGYRRLAELGVPFELLRYEDLVRDIPGFLKRIETKHALARRREKDIVRDASTKKGDAERLADYQAKYRVDKVRDAVAPDDYDYIIEKFGKDRLRWLGYPDA